MDSTIKQGIEMVTFLGKTLPDLYEVILYDLRKKEIPILAQSKQILQYGKETRKFIQELMNRPDLLNRGMILNQTLEAKMGNLAKCSIYFIKEEEQTIAALCINMRCNDIVMIHSLVYDLLQFQPNVLYDDVSGEEASSESTEVSEECKEVTLDTIAAYVADTRIAPERLSQSEKMGIIIDLYDAGVFDLKGAVARAAKELALSEQSVYRYLSKIKRAEE